MWRRVVFATECDEDGNCPLCGIDFAECDCPGPTMENYEYKEVNGVMYGRLLKAVKWSKNDGSKT